MDATRRIKDNPRSAALLSGLLLAALLGFSDAAYAQAPATSGFPLSARTTTPNLNARSGPGTNFPVAYQFKKQGSRVALFSYNNGWYKVSPSYSKMAWVHGSYLKRDALTYRQFNASGMYDYYFDALAPPPPPTKTAAKKQRRATLPVSARITTIDGLKFQDRAGRHIDWRPARHLVEHIVVYEMRDESQYRILPGVSPAGAWVLKERVELTPERPLPPYSLESVHWKHRRSYGPAYFKDLAQVHKEFEVEEITQLQVKQAMDSRDRRRRVQETFESPGPVIWWLGTRMLVAWLIAAAAMSLRERQLTLGDYVGTCLAWIALLIVLPHTWETTAVIGAVVLCGVYLIWVFTQKEKSQTNYRPWEGVVMKDDEPTALQPFQGTDLTQVEEGGSFLKKFVSHHGARIESRTKKKTKDVIAEEMRAQARVLQAGKDILQAGKEQTDTAFEARRSVSRYEQVEEYVDKDKGELKLDKKLLEIELAKAKLEELQLKQQLAQLENPPPAPAKRKKKQGFGDVLRREIGLDSDLEREVAEECAAVRNDPTKTPEQQEHLIARIRAVAEQYARRRR